MKKKILWMLISCLMVLSLVMSSCGPAAVEEEGKTVTGTLAEKEGATSVTVEEEEGGEEVVTEESQYGGRITIAYYYEMTQWDPWGLTASPSKYLHSFLYEKLGMADWTVDRDSWSFQTQYTPLKYITGRIAESWESPDPQTFVFHIRPGIYWQNKAPVNGRELDAYDVEYCFHRLLGLGSGYTEKSPHASQACWKWVTSVEATDKYTVVMKTDEPRPLMMLYQLSIGNCNQIYPREVVEEYGDLNDWKNIVQSTPFFVKDWISGSSLTLERNPNYWQFDPLNPENRLPYLDELQVLVITDISTRIAALRTGKIDVLQDVEWEDAEILRQNTPGLEEYATKAGSSQTVTLRHDLEPTSDVRVRRALSMAIDREAISQEYYGGNADPFCGLVATLYTDIAPQIDEYPEEDQQWYKYDPEGAKELLAEAGYPTGFDAGELAIAAFQPLDLAELIIDYLSRVNVTASIKVLEAGVYRPHIYGRKHEVFAWQWAGMDCFPLEALNYHYGGEVVRWNPGNVDDPHFNDLLDRIAAEPDQAERTELMREATMYDASQCFNIYLPFAQAFNFWWPWVKGYQGERKLDIYNNGGVYTYLWLDQKIKKEMGFD